MVIRKLFTVLQLIKHIRVSILKLELILSNIIRPDITEKLLLKMKSQIVRIVLIVIMIFIIINNFIFFPGNILSWDVFGYYLYLPLQFIYHDLGLNDYSIMDSIIAKYHNTATFYQAIKMQEGNFVMKYSMGLSFFYAPFFFIGHLIAMLSGYPEDGFSLPYQYSIFVGSMVYSIIGIWALSKVLIRFFSKTITAVVLITIVFSTNYIVHITMFGQNAMSQNYLFMTYALILWLSILWHESYRLKYAVLLGIICGITILSRPSEIVCLVIPALWGIKNKRSIIEKANILLKYKSQLIIVAVILFSFGMMQLIYWKIYTGNFLFYSYGGNPGEGFEFFHPFLLEVLFSFRKGWLIYTPVMIFAFIGFYFMYKENRSVFYALSIYVILNIYVVSSWSCWWYAQSFSQRSLVQAYPVMAIGLGYFITWLSNQKMIYKSIGYALIVGCLFLNLFQTIQFYYGSIDGARMTKEYYFKTFGKLHATEEDKKLLLIERSFDGTESFNNEKDYNFKKLEKLDFEDTEIKDSTQFNSGKNSFKLDSTTIYSPGIEVPFYNITKKDHAWVRVTAFVYPTKDVVNEPFSLVIHFNHNEYAYKYVTYDSDKMKLELNKWNKISFDYLTPEVRRKSDCLKVYLWHRGKAPLFVDDIQVNIYERK